MGKRDAGYAMGMGKPLIPFHQHHKTQPSSKFIKSTIDLFHIVNH
jgi:hypothetical protein